MDVENVIWVENVEFFVGEVEFFDCNFEVRVVCSFLIFDDFVVLIVVMGDDGYLVCFGEIVCVEFVVEDDEIEFCGDGVNMIGLGIIK